MAFPQVGNAVVLECGTEVAIATADVNILDGSARLREAEESQAGREGRTETARVAVEPSQTVLPRLLLFLKRGRVFCDLSSVVEKELACGQFTVGPLVDY